MTSIERTANVATRLVVSGIRVYRRRLSPWKGFRCAHAAYFGGESCSAAVLRLVETHGLVEGWPSVLERFAACRDAYDLLGSRGVTQDGFRARGVCCCGPIPIPFRCGVI
ncbi:membrane protein insertion efficiency factor YidD [Deinococcus yavapaiensis]|uniref:Hemolytic domain-containing protein n=1 Tax=Deinococcus yavapaiensis KR-236 TaxID=694435 RepID=A0A318S2L9_9DEIO|nr:membrane protein insertion efficiency factor YidD [Deinococcus yavapaiensis]PYE52781.1 hemolytic domain-containing protein [Deinococcus yavapaiensis KR-236]